MDRRTFLAATAGATLLPLAGRAAMIDYSPGVIDTLLDAGETLFLDFYASWCGTCQAQRRVIEALWVENPAYLEHITFIEVNWDNYARSDLTKALQIPRRSTLVTIGPDRREIGRIVAGVRRDDIKALMDGALAVATAQG